MEGPIFILAVLKDSHFSVSNVAHVNHSFNAVDEMKFWFFVTFANLYARNFIPLLD
jgi:hypothetical protein